MTEFSKLAGLTLRRIDVAPDKERITFIADGGRSFVQFHSQDCCENIEVEEIVGDLADLLDTPIILAEEVEYDNEQPPEVENRSFGESFTWTFYKLATAKGHVTIRWLGESNGYYSESVTFCEERP